MILKYVAAIVLGYLLGSILFSYDLPKLLRHTDITLNSDDKNPGAANAFKNAGIPIGILCLICDMFKGFAPVFVASRYIDVNSLMFSLVMLAPVLGHATAPFHKTIGGKAIAVSFGVLLGVFPSSKAVIALAFWYILFAAVFRIRPNSKCSIITYTMFSFTMLCGTFFLGDLQYTVGCLLISAVVIYRHAVSGLDKNALREEGFEDSDEDVKVSV